MDLSFKNSEYSSLGWQVGLLKVSGTIDGFPVSNINLAPRKGEDRIISINKKIRDAIGKTGGDPVMVTLYLHI